MTVLSDKEAIKKVQRGLAAKGFYTGTIDGLWGGGTDGAFNALLAAASVLTDGAAIPPAKVSDADLPLAWGAKVSPVFRARVWWMSRELGVPADDLMAAMAWESGRSFRPDIRNMAGSGATGLIQFMPSTALGLFETAEQIAGYTDAQRAAKGRAYTDKLAAMTAEDQLNYVFKYFKPYTGRLKNLGDLYMAILWPAGVGKPDTFVLWEKAKRPTTYRQNAGLDVDKNGAITRAEALSKVSGLLAEGRRAPNFYAGA